MESIKYQGVVIVLMDLKKFVLENKFGSLTIFLLVLWWLSIIILVYVRPFVYLLIPVFFFLPLLIFILTIVSFLKKERTCRKIILLVVLSVFVLLAWNIISCDGHIPWTTYVSKSAGSSFGYDCACPIIPIGPDCHPSHLIDEGDIAEFP